MEKPRRFLEMRDGKNLEMGKYGNFLEIEKPGRLLEMEKPGNIRDGKYWLEIEKYRNF